MAFAVIITMKPSPSLSMNTQRVSAVAICQLVASIVLLVKMMRQQVVQNVKRVMSFSVEHANLVLITSAMATAYNAVLKDV